MDPISRMTAYMRRMSGETSIALPEPVTRLERYWYYICQKLEEVSK